MKNYEKYIIMMILFFHAVLGVYAYNISNLSASQIPNTKDVRISFTQDGFGGGAYLVIDGVQNPSLTRTQANPNYANNTLEYEYIWHAGQDVANALSTYSISAIYENESTWH